MVQFPVFWTLTSYLKRARSSCHHRRFQVARGSRYTPKREHIGNPVRYRFDSLFIARDLNIDLKVQCWSPVGPVRQQEILKVREYRENLTLLCFPIVIFPFSDEPLLNQIFMGWIQKRDLHRQSETHKKYCGASTIKAISKVHRSRVSELLNHVMVMYRDSLIATPFGREFSFKQRFTANGFIQALSSPKGFVHGD